MTKWKPKEIIVNEKVEDDPVTKYVLKKCKGVPVREVDNGKATTIVKASKVLKDTGTMLEKILAGKNVLYIAPTGNDVVDLFTMPEFSDDVPQFRPPETRLKRLLLSVRLVLFEAHLPRCVSFHHDQGGIR